MGRHRDRNLDAPAELVQNADQPIAGEALRIGLENARYARQRLRSPDGTRVPIQKPQGQIRLKLLLFRIRLAAIPVNTACAVNPRPGYE